MKKVKMMTLQINCTQCKVGGWILQIPDAAFYDDTDDIDMKRKLENDLIVCPVVEMFYQGGNAKHISPAESFRRVWECNEISPMIHNFIKFWQRNLSDDP